MSKYFILVFLGAAALALLSGCVPSIVKGSGTIVKESRIVSGFDRVTLKGFGEVYVTQGEVEGLVVEADDNLLANIKTEVQDGTLVISYDREALKFILPSQPVRFHVNMKEIAGFRIAGSGRFEAGQVEAENLELKIDGSGRMDLEQVKAQAVQTRVGGSGKVSITRLEADSIDTEISGSGKIVLAGQVQKQSLEIGGSGNYLAEGLQSEAAQVRIGGSGNAELAVSGSLEVTISGSGKVAYSGQPRVSESVSGSARIVSLSEN